MIQQDYFLSNQGHNITKELNNTQNNTYDIMDCQATILYYDNKPVPVEICVECNAEFECIIEKFLET